MRIPDKISVNDVHRASPRKLLVLTGPQSFQTNLFDERKVFMGQKVGFVRQVLGYGSFVLPFNNHAESLLAETY